MNKLLSQYGSDANPTAHTNNTFKIELELRKAKEQRNKLIQEVEENKLREEEQN